jgi:Mn-dependent DtxR family transcriptional regulator
LATVRGRPVTKDDLVRSLGVAPRGIDAALRRLTRQGRIKPVSYSGKTFYEPA